MSDYMYSVKRTIAEAQTALEIGAPQQAKFFLDIAREVVDLHTEPKYTEVLHGLFTFFKDGDQTFTRMLERANCAQNEIMKISNELSLRRNSDDTVDLTDLTETHEFFYFFNMLMWELKPLAMEAEHAHEKDLIECEENRRKREAIEAKKKQEKAD